MNPTFPFALQGLAAPQKIRSVAIVTPSGPIMGFFELTILNAPYTSDLFRPCDAELKFAGLNKAAADAVATLNGRVDFYIKNVRSTDPDPDAKPEFAHFFAPALEVLDGAYTTDGNFQEGEFDVRLNLGANGEPCFNWYEDTVSLKTFKRTFS
jgi:hypothetical protein